MRKFKLVIRNLALLLACALLPAGCGEQQTEAPAKPKVVSQKITPGESEAQKVQPPQAIPPPPPAGADAEAVPGEDAAAGGEPSAMSDAELAERTPAGRLRGPAIMSLTYRPEGKIDPFLPLFSSEKVAPEPEKAAEGGEKAQAAAEEEEKHVPRTPLEKMDLGQLKLVAIVLADSGNRAMVQDATGKGYVLTKGTYIGIKQGFVKEILADRVIVEEKEKDLYGKKVLREKEMMLQKPRGEI